MRLFAAFALLLLPLAAQAAQAPRTAREAQRVGTAAVIAAIQGKRFKAPAATEVVVKLAGADTRIRVTTTRANGLKTYRDLKLDDKLHAAEAVRVSELPGGDFSAGVTLYGSHDTYRARVATSGHVMKVTIAGKTMRYFPRTGLLVNPRDPAQWGEGSADVEYLREGLDARNLVTALVTPSSGGRRDGWVRSAEQLEQRYADDMKP